MSKFLTDIIPLGKIVPLWKVLLVGIPVALVIHYLFSLGKSRKPGALSPILWAVLTVTVLFFWSEKGGNGKGGDDDAGKDEPVAEKPEIGQDQPEAVPDNNGENGEGSGPQAPAPKPIALEIRFNENSGIYTITDATNNQPTETANLETGLMSLMQSGYVFTRIDTYNLSQAQNNYLKDNFDRKDCKVETHN